MKYFKIFTIIFCMIFLRSWIILADENDNAPQPPPPAPPAAEESAGWDCTYSSDQDGQLFHGVFKPVN